MCTYLKNVSRQKTARVCRLGWMVVAVWGHASVAAAVGLTSPKGDVRVELDLVEGRPTWEVFYRDVPVLERGRLGVRTGPDAAGLSALDQVGCRTQLVREVVSTVWGKTASYEDHYRELVWDLRENGGAGRTLRVVVRAYASGVALRYELGVGSGWGTSVLFAGDETTFAFAEDFTAWAHQGEHEPRGPLRLGEFRRERDPTIRLPLLLRRSDGAHFAVMEGAILDHAPYVLAPCDDGPLAFCCDLEPSILPGDGRTSWRVLLCGQTAGDLLVSPMPYCLNPPCRIADTSWIKPGVALWDWRAWGARAPDGFTYGLDMPSWRRFIDFASSNHIAYLVLDAGWYGLEFDRNSDPRTSRTYLLEQPDPDKPALAPVVPPENWSDPIDIPALIRYAGERDVGIFLYVNDLARGHSDFEETLALYHQWGAAGIKYGFMKGSGQDKVLQTRQIVELCAKYHLHCNFHDGPVPPSGDRRTWPNYLSREFCHSQSDALRVFSPSGFCKQVFVNMVAGPLDMCNGLYTLADPASTRPKIFRNVDTTLAGETARTMIVFSGLAVLPDSPDAYAAHADMFDYMRRLPMTWDETRILHGEIGRYICTARRSGRRWFISSATDEEARMLPVHLDFLEPDVRYTARLYEDEPDAHYLHNREAFRVRVQAVRRGDILEARMAPGGGHSIYLEPQ